MFLLQATLMIPNVSVNPTLEEIQEVLVLGGKHISGLSKGVAQWTGGKANKVSYTYCIIKKFTHDFYFYFYFVALVTRQTTALTSPTQ